MVRTAVIVDLDTIQYDPNEKKVVEDVKAMVAGRLTDAGMTVTAILQATFYMLGKKYAEEASIWNRYVHQVLGGISAEAAQILERLRVGEPPFPKDETPVVQAANEGDVKAAEAALASRPPLKLVPG